MAQGSAVFLIAIVITASLYGCGEKGGGHSAPIIGTETLTIEAYKEICRRDSLQLCYVASRDGDQDTFLLSKPIRGFNFHWGKRQTIRVNVYKDQQLEVVRVLEQTQESYEHGFVIEMTGRALRSLGNCTFAIGNEVKFMTNTSRTCRSVNSLIASGNSKYLQFGYSGNSVFPIRLESVGSAEQRHSE